MQWNVSIFYVYIYIVETKRLLQKMVKYEIKFS